MASKRHVTFRHPRDPWSFSGSETSFQSLICHGCGFLFHRVATLYDHTCNVRSPPGRPPNIECPDLWSPGTRKRPKPIHRELYANATGYGDICNKVPKVPADASQNISGTYDSSAENIASSTTESSSEVCEIGRGADEFSSGSLCTATGRAQLNGLQPTKVTAARVQEPLYQCCETNFMNNLSFADHLLRGHRALLCETCCTVFSVNDCAQHCAVGHSATIAAGHAEIAQSSKFICPWPSCSKKHTSVASVIAHVWNHHKSDTCHGEIDAWRVPAVMASPPPCEVVVLSDISDSEVEYGDTDGETSSGSDVVCDADSGTELQDYEGIRMKYRLEKYHKSLNLKLRNSSATRKARMEYRVPRDDKRREVEQSGTGYPRVLKTKSTPHAIEHTAEGLRLMKSKETKEANEAAQIDAVQGSWRDAVPSLHVLITRLSEDLGDGFIVSPNSEAHGDATRCPGWGACDFGRVDHYHTRIDSGVELTVCDLPEVVPPGVADINNNDTLANGKEASGDLGSDSGALLVKGETPAVCGESGSSLMDCDSRCNRYHVLTTKTGDNTVTPGRQVKEGKLELRESNVTDSKMEGRAVIASTKAIHSELLINNCDSRNNSESVASEVDGNHKRESKKRAPKRSTLKSTKEQTCSKCSFVGMKIDLRIHNEAVHHSGIERRFRCPWDGCTLAYRQRHILWTHMLRHSDIMPFHCKFCPYSCRQLISIGKHVRKFHPQWLAIRAMRSCYRLVECDAQLKALYSSAVAQAKQPCEASRE